METSVNNKCRAFTSLEQSRKLAEILPLESADMCWNVFVDGTSRILPINDWDLVKDGSGNVKFYHAWSLTALISVIPNYKLSSEHNYHSCAAETPFGKETVAWFDNPVDACVAMIEKLHEQKKI